MTYRQYLELGRVERHCMHNELCRMIDEANPPKPDGEEGEGGGGAIRPKHMRR